MTNKYKRIIFACAFLFYCLIFCFRFYTAENEIRLVSSGPDAEIIHYSCLYKTSEDPVYSQRQIVPFDNKKGKIPAFAPINQARIDFGSGKMELDLDQIVFHRNLFEKAVISGKDIFECYRKNAHILWKTNGNAVHIKITGADPCIIPKAELFDQRVVYQKDWLRISCEICVFASFLILTALILWVKPVQKIFSAVIDFPSKPRNVYILLAALLLITTILGLTGSSLGYVRQKTSGLISMDEQKLLGEYRDIRRDECLFRTPFAIGAMKNNCPVFDDNFSIGGRNNLVRFYTGVPVWHLSSIVHPQTWGFMLLPLRQALAWYWFFPFLVSFAGIFALLNILFEGQSKENFLITFATALLPTMALFSFWTLQVIGYVCGAAVLFLHFLKNCDQENISQSSSKKRILFSLLTGWSAAAVCLLLMAPRLVPTVTLVGIIVLMYIWENKIYRTTSWKNFFLWSIPGAMLFFIIMGTWFFDSAETIKAVSNTLYPGKRFCAGGNFTLWDAFCAGWWNIYNIYHNYGSTENICARSSYGSFLPILIFIFIFHSPVFRKDKKITGIIIFVLFAWIYQVSGIPEIVAKFTLWSKSHDERVNGAIALAQAFALAAWIKYSAEVKLSKRFSLIVSAIYLVFLAVVFILNPSFDFFIKNNWSEFTDFQSEVAFYAIVLFLILSMFFYCLSRKPKYFVWLYAVFAAVLSLPFNPLCIAPSKISSIFEQELKVRPQDLAHEGRILCIGRGRENPAMYATGQKVYGEYFFYPDAQIRKQFFQSGEYADVFNAKGLVFLKIGKKSEIVFQENSTFQKNFIFTVYLAPDYDFSQLPVDYVIIQSYEKMPNPDNQSLKLISQKRGIRLYKVCR